MPQIKTRKNKKTHNKTVKKVSKRVLKMWEDPTSVWGKNKPLEKFWKGLASGKNVVVIYKNGKNKIVNQPRKITESNKFYNELDDNKEIEAVLTSSLSQDAYERYLYPKAKDNSVEYVIKNYKKYFKYMGTPPKDLLEKGAPLMKKVRFVN